MTAITRKRNVPGYVDEFGRFRPIRSASYIGSKSAPRKARVADRKKYSKAKAGDLGKARQARALEDPWDRDARLEREAKAAQQRERERIERQLENEIYGETSGRTSRGKGRSLAQFVRAEGGINTKKTVRKGRTRYGDSLENFTRKGSGSTGLVTTTAGKGKSLDYMHQAAREAGYDVPDMDDLLDALDNEIRSGKKTYSTHGSMTYNPAVTEKEFAALQAETRRLASRRKNGVRLKNPIGWFRDVSPVTPEAVKKLYKTLATQYHPDKPGGDLRSMQEINQDYAKALKMAISGEGNAARADAERKAAVPLREAIEFAVTLPESVNVVIRGLWLWLEGGTFAAKDQIKAFQSSDGNRFKWASKKKAWFFAAVPSANRRGEMSFDDIDRLHGRELVNERKRRMTLKGNPAAKKNPDAISMFAQLAGGVASALSISEHLSKRTTMKKRGKTTAKARKTVNSGTRRAAVKRKNPSQPNLFKRQPKGELYVLTIGSGDDLISVYLHDGDKDGFSKRFKTMAGAKAYATRNKVKLVQNPKRNGIIKRAWARSRAASEYRRELRLEAAAERSRKRRQKAEQAARSNPALSAGETKVIRAIGPYRIGTPFAANVSEASRERIIASLRKKGLLTANGALTSEGYSVANKLKKNPARSASGKTAVARAANGKKAVARSAKANPRSTKTGPAPKFGIGDRVYSYWNTNSAGSIGQMTFDDYGKFWKYAVNHPTLGRRWINEKSLRKTPVKKTTARKNPKSTARRRTFEMFQGRKVTTARPMLVSNHAPANLDALGDLVELKIAGGPVLKFNGKGVKLCAAGGKLWIAGKRFAKANPSGKPNEINPIGEIDHVVYGTYKPHHGDHNYTHYIHKLGEESGKRPILCVDREGFPIIRGGNYKIEARGIVD